MRLDDIRFGVLCLGFFLVVDIVPVRTAGLLVLLGWAALEMRAIPALLVLAASIQDARGLAGQWAYLAFVGPATIYLVRWAAMRTLRGEVARQLPRSLGRVGLLALVVVGYAVLASVLHIRLEGATQSMNRPPLAIGALILTMAGAGLVSAMSMETDARLRRHVSIAAVVAVANLLLVAVGQGLFGATFGHSPSGLGALETAGQLQEASALGIPRLTGTLGHPNSLPLFVCLLSMVPLVASRATRPPVVAGIFVLGVGSAAGLLALSKAGTALALLAGGSFLWARLGLRAMLVPAVAGIALLVSEVDWSLWRTALRFEWGSGSYRSQAWGAVLREFELTDWVFGRGLSSWQPFFQQNIGVPLIDPHNVLLSLPGTFGVLGPILYALVVVELVRAYRRGRLPSVRAGALFIAGLLLGKDLVTVPTLLGNTTASFLAWLLLASTLAGAHYESVRRSSQITVAAP